MFIRDNVSLATRNFKTRKLRTFLTVLGISVGIGTTLFLVSLGYGLQKVLLEKIAKSDALLTLDVASANSSVIKIDKKVVDDLSNIENVIEVSPLQVVLSQIKMNDVTSNVKLSSVSNSFFRLGGIEFLKGKKYEGNNDTKIILSTGALTSLGIENFEEALGKEVDITLIIPKENQGDNNELVKENNMVPFSQKFEICGIVDDPSESSGYIPGAWVADVAPDYYDEVKVKIGNQKNLENVRSAIVEKGFTVLALTDTVDQANKIFSIIQIILSLFGIVALAVSAIGMFNTMTIALLERTNEIGIMKAIGASKREILLIFLTESILIGFLGGVGGIIVGFMGSETINYVFNFLARNLGGQPVDIFYTPLWFILFIIIFSTLVGFFTGVYPASRAARLNPLVALRYK
jgi:putative ABC transport system permease protein